jgi:hypothetical protein
VALAGPEAGDLVGGDLDLVVEALGDGVDEGAVRVAVADTLDASEDQALHGSSFRLHPNSCAPAA